MRQSEKHFPLLRYYEMAGGSHVDAQLNAVGGQALVRDLGLPPSFCPAPAIPYNPIRIGYVQSALMEALEQWITKGRMPPKSRFMTLAMEGGVTVLARDADGNGLGGIRPPQLQVPLGTYLESNSGPGFCGLFGGFDPFSMERLEELYPSHKRFAHKFIHAVFRSKRERFLLREDARALTKEVLQPLDK